MSSVLFLQGPPSVFWRELSDAFEAAGVKTHRVNFSLGDQLYWRKRGAINFRRPLREWPRFLKELIGREGITDILYYADRLPYHRFAARVARRMGVRCHAVEFGYLRPDWVTLERDGMGRFSHFPNDPDHIRRIAAKVEKPDLHVHYTHTFGQEATNEVVYNLVAYFGRLFYPFYKADKYYDPLVDYLSWLPRMARRRLALPAGGLDDGRVSYLVALQLQSDYQIRANSPYRHLSQMLEQVIASFAAHAPEDARLVIKQHPLDNGWERWNRVTEKLSARYGVGDRIVFIEEGALGAIFPHVRGAIVANSTTGIHSLRAGVPTIALGTAIFDVPGLTHQGGLDSFWRHPEPIDKALLADFVRALAGTIQVKGNFYHREGRRRAIDGIVARVTGGLVNCPDAFVERPPRLAWRRLPAPATAGAGETISKAFEIFGRPQQPAGIAENLETGLANPASSS
jgi:capsular polysaccharide export protein